ncbi:MAG: PilZ domain-containing protein [Acidobacteriota bacterium]|nr:PilZ domain-containing protein [Acidobacteriota bacterium]
MRSAALTLIRSRDYKMEHFLQSEVLERRSKVRFPLELRVRYRSLAKRCPAEGTGVVVNMSRSGVLISSEHGISEDVRVELSIEWPSLLDGRVPLQVVTVGRVVRCAQGHFAVVLSRYQFRTSKKTKLPMQLVGGACG